MDEHLPLFVPGILLVGVVFGPVALGIAGVYLYGSIKFAESYKDSQNSRFGGFMPMMIAQQLVSGFVFLVVFITLIKPLLPLAALGL